MEEVSASKANGAATVIFLNIFKYLSCQLSGLLKVQTLPCLPVWA
jgi:hypothetical protein